MPQNLGDSLRNTAQRFPKKTAIVFGQKTISFKTLDETTDKLAAGLAHRGIRKGMRVAIFLDNCPEFIISYYAIAKTGATIVPVNFMFKTDEATYILRDCEASAIITSRPYVEFAQNLQLRTDKLTTVICTNQIDRPHVLNFPALKRDDTSSLDSIKPHQADCAVILYTSGTTGHPKGAMLSHRNLLVNAADCSRNMNIDHRLTLICILPLFHSFAATVCMNLPILTGAKIVLMKSVKPFKRVVRAIRRNRVNVFVGIPSMFTLLANFKLPRILHTPLIKLFNPLKFCVSGAAALPEKTLKTFEKKFRVPLLEGYGLTEAAPVVTLNPGKGIRKAGSIGLRLAPHLDVKIIDENGRELKHNAVGELIVRGPSVMQGYFNQPEATKEAIMEGWLHTGDMAKVDAEGYFFIAGRKKEMVNVRGLNVYPREIEDVLYQHPAVKETAVIGVQDEHKGEVPKAFVVLKETASATERELLTYIRQKLAPYKIPKRVVFRKSLPKNSTGKILKRILINEENDNR